MKTATSSINRIRYSELSNAQERFYGVTKLLTNNKAFFTSRQPITVEFVEPYWNVTALSAKINNELLALPGIVELKIGPYEIHVSLAPVFYWADVHDSIVKVLVNNCFPGEGVEIQEKSASS